VRCIQRHGCPAPGGIGPAARPPAAAAAAVSAAARSPFNQRNLAFSWSFCNIVAFPYAQLADRMSAPAASGAAAAAATATVGTAAAASCAARAPADLADAELPVLDPVSDYEKIKRIGEGTFGIVCGWPLLGSLPPLCAAAACLLPPLSGARLPGWSLAPTTAPPQPPVLACPADKARDKRTGELVALKKLRMEREREGE
jgi:hypothetical protein